MIIDITSFGQNAEQTELPELGGVVDITPEDFRVGSFKEDIPEEEPEVIEEEPQEDSTESTKAEEVEETDDVESYSEVKEYFEKASSLNILKTPEGFEWDDKDPYGSLEKVTDYTNNQLLAQVENSFYSQFKDPVLRQVVSTALEGGSFIDVAELITQTQEINTYDKLDVSDEEQASKLYADYLEKTTKFNSNKISKLLDLAKEDDELEELATEAKLYFLEEAKAKSAALTQAALQEKEAAEVRAKEYWTNFYSALNERQIGDDVKKDIQTAFQVTDNNVFKYQEVFGEVTKNSDHFIDLLMFLNTYDPEKGFNYEREVRKQATQTAKSFKERIEKEITRNSSKGNPSDRKGEKIIPRKNSYMENIRRY